MAIFQLKKQLGKLEESHHLDFVLSDLPDGDLRIRFENATNKKEITVNETVESSIFVNGVRSIDGYLNLQIPDYSSYSLYSIFVFIDRKIGYSYKTYEILYSSYEIQYDVVSNENEIIYLSESYIDFESRNTISLEGEPNSKYLVSINDKRFILLTNDKGIGEICFYGKDVVSDFDIKTLQKFPVLFCRDGGELKFANIFIYVFPPSIYTKAALDWTEIQQLKNTVSNNGGTIIGNFTSLPSQYELIDLSEQPVPSTLSSDLQTTCIYNSYEDSPDPDDPGSPTDPTDPTNPPDPVSPNPISSTSPSVVGETVSGHYVYNKNSALLPNGQSVTAIVGRDLSSSNVEGLRSYLVSLNISSLPSNDNAYKIYPFIRGMAYHFDKVDNKNRIAFYFDKEYYDIISQAYTYSGSSDTPLYIWVLDSKFNYQIFPLPVKSAFGSKSWFPDHDNISSFKRIVVETDSFDINTFDLDIKYQIMVNEVSSGGDSGSKPLTYPVTDVSDSPASALYNLEYITDENESILSVESASVSTNKYYYKTTASPEYFYIYVVSVCNINGKSQLFLKSLKLASTWKDVESDVDWASSDLIEESEWSQLTSTGNNRRPSLSVDKYNNLHIVWESDRCDSNLYQLYYGCLGTDERRLNNAVLFSSINKYKKDSDNKNIFSYSSCPVFEYDPYDPYSYLDKLSLSWSYSERNDAVVNIIENDTRFSSFTIDANTKNDEGLVFVPVRQDNNSQFFDTNKDNYAIEVEFSLSINNLNKSNTENVSYEFIEDKVINDKYINKRWDNWISNFDSYNNNSDFTNANLYKYKDNLFVLGKQENIYNKIIPLASMISQSDMESNTDTDINHDKGFSIAASGVDYSYYDNDLDFDIMYAAPYFIGLVPEQIRFQATNTETFEEFCDRNDLTVEAGVDQYIDKEEYIIYTGRYKMVTYIRNDHLVETNEIRYSVDGENASYIVRQSSDPFYLNEKKAFKITLYWNKLPSDVLSRLLGINPFDTENDFLGAYPPPIKYGGNILITIDNDPILSSSFFSERWVENSESNNQYNYIGDRAYPVIVFGVPSGNRILTQELLPYQSRVFDNIDIRYEFDDVSVGVPTLDINTDVVVLPSYYFDINKMMSDYSTDIYWYGDAFDYIDFNLGKFDFPQIPITFAGINSAAKIKDDILGNIHLVWNSNRYKKWDIYYASNYDYTNPFIFDTQISNTKGNSLNPDIAVDDNGNRAIVWQDNTNEKFDIYMAKSKICSNGSKSNNHLNSYESYCVSGKIRDRNFNILNSFIDPYDTEFDLTFYDSFYKDKIRYMFYFIGQESGYYKFQIDIYSDVDKTNLVKSLYSDEVPALWTINGLSLNDDGTFYLEYYEYIKLYTLEYNTLYDNDLKDRLLFAKLYAIK